MLKQQSEMQVVNVKSQVQKLKPDLCNKGIVKPSYTLHVTKLRWLGLPNWIVDNWKLNSNEFGWQLYNHLDFKFKIGLWIKDDDEIQIKLTNFQFFKLFSMQKVDLKIEKETFKMFIQRLKMIEFNRNKKKKVDFLTIFNQFLINSTGFWASRLKLDLF